MRQDPSEHDGENPRTVSLFDTRAGAPQEPPNQALLTGLTASQGGSTGQELTAHNCGSEGHTNGPTASCSGSTGHSQINSKTRRKRPTNYDALDQRPNIE